MDGLVVLNKQQDWTSRDAVNRVQRLVRPAKVGHAGTLDPLATGVLVVCIGRATRLIGYVQQLPKEYLATFELGVASPSDDATMPLTRAVGEPVPALADIQRTLPQFLGTIDQRPPAYSAIKIDGERSYNLARRGVPVEIAPRRVEIYSIQLLAFNYPRLKLNIRCSSGTYIRSIGRDLAAALGASAVMTGLVRTAIGDFKVDAGLDPASITLDILNENLQPPLAAVSRLPTANINAEQVRRLSLGGLLLPAEIGLEHPPDAIAAIDAAGTLAAILKPTVDGRLKPSPNLSPPS